MRKRKPKIKWKGIIITLVIIVLGCLIFFIYRTIRVQNIYVTGNYLLKEYEIIEIAGLKNYPYLYTVSSKRIENDLKKKDIVSNVKVHKSLLGKITIMIEENKILYQNMDGKYTLSNNSEITWDNIFGVPLLINDCGDLCKKFNQKFTLIDKDIVSRISEMEYKPNDLDKERFLFYMNDGNYVYITLNKINLINSYNEIYPTLEGKKGILYLDSGNHFEIKKNMNS